MKEDNSRGAWAKFAIIVALLFLLAGMCNLLFEIKYHTVVANKRESLNMVTNHLDVHLNSRLTALQLIATDAKILSMIPSEIQPELNRAVKVMGFFNAVVFDIEGNFIAEGEPERHIGQVYDQESFAKAARGSPVISGRIVYSDLNSAYVSLRVPIITLDGEIKGVLVAGLTIDTIRNFIESKSQKDDYIFIIDHNTNFIAHPKLAEIYPENKAFAKYEGQFFKTSEGQLIDTAIIDGFEKLYIYTAFDKTDWRIVRAIPVDLLYYEVLKAMIPELTFIVLMIFLIGLSYRVVRQSQRFHAERENMRLERLTTVSTIAAGLAHEIRNPLTAIKGFVQLMLRKTDRPVQPSHLQIMLTEIERIERLTNEFRMLARPPRPPKYEPQDLVKIINDVLFLIEQQAEDLGLEIVFQVDTSSGNNQLLWPILVNSEHAPEGFYLVFGDEGQLKQVLLNLLRNAVEATSEGGNILVTLGKHDQNIVITVKDTGVGIPPEILTRLGTPFFTTKESGTGLGLSVCFSIIQQHGGKIEINSDIGEGTKVEITLPKLKN
ncbi:sensor histidine kinase [Dendrosporobacter sp. 1207_IL3150]|uniref:sensor histidine kinase n=1 Tax=Dendrosporobacter sp. 1207_IL3150 TaxID=3084054 RepID=UPI002FDB3ABA